MESSANALNPPPYTVLDCNDPEGKFATDVGRMITSRCRNPEGTVDPNMLRRILHMVVTVVGNETGVLLSVATTPAISSPPNDNPRNPHEWNWAVWARRHLPERGMGDMKLSKQMKICNILGGNVGRDYIKINSLLQHELHKGEALIQLDSCLVKNIVQSEKSCSEIFYKLFSNLSNCYYNPTGMIMAAIKSGYLPREDIVKLHNLPV